MNNTIDINHRNNLEDKVVKKKPGLLSISSQEVKNPLDHKPRRSFPWMLPGHNPHTPLSPAPTIRTSNLNDINLIRAHSPTHIPNPDHIPDPLISDPLPKKVPQIRHPIRYRMTKIDHIPLINRLILKTEHIIRPLTGLLPMLL